MKKAVLREYLLKREAEKLGKSLQPVMKILIEEKKYTKPKLAKELKKQKAKKGE